MNTFITYYGMVKMQIVGILLTVLSIVLIAAPVAAVVVMYQDNFAELVIPPEVNNLINGNSSNFIVNDIVSGNAFGEGSVLNSLIIPEFVTATINPEANTFTIILDITNNVNYTFVLNMFNSEVQTAQDKCHLVTVELSDPPVTLVSGETSRITIVGSWTATAETHFIENYADAITISVELINTSIEINGVTVALSAPIAVDVPLTLEG
ncbi:MAG: hypothetical protein WDA42_06765 [Candidatus Bathyarchaeia archaeon]